MTRVFRLSVLFSVMLAASAFAQIATGSLKGQVELSAKTDAPKIIDTSSPVVMAYGSDNQRAAVHAKDGNFAFSDLLPDYYNVKAFVPGYCQASEAGMFLRPGGSANLDLTLVPCETQTISPDGSLSADLSNGRITIWDLNKGRILARFPGPGVTALAIDPQGSKLAAASSKGTIRYWDLKSGQPLESNLVRFPPSQLSFSGDGKSINVQGPKNQKEVLALEQVSPITAR